MDHRESQKTCCCCFSIDTGAKIIFAIVCWDMCLQVFAMIWKGLWAEYVPLFFLSLGFVIMFLLPFFVKEMDTVKHRTRTAWYYFFCIAILGHIWIVLGLTGLGADELEQIC